MGNRDTVKNFIITLTGPSGCGKSYIMDRIMGLQDTFSNEGLIFKPVVFPKYVTRPMRYKEIQDIIENKQIDIISVDYIPDDCDVKYQTYGKQYAIRLADLQDKLDEGKCPIVVINDVRVVEELQRAFPNQVLALFLFREIPKKESFVNEAKIRGGGASQEIEDRFNKATAIYRTYIENIGLFNRVILNVGNKNTADYARIQVYNLLKSILQGELSLKSKKDGHPKMFIIAGHAKSGKDEIIKSVDDMGRLQANIIPKYTSRRQDDDDGKEMICRLIPSKKLMQRFEKEYKKELISLEEKYNSLKEQAGTDINELASAYEWLHKKQRGVEKPTKRFWNALEEEEKRIANNIRDRIASEVAPSHVLGNNLFEMSLQELKDLYCTAGYHKEGIDPVAVSASWNEQQIVNALVEETSVENDACRDKLDNVKKLKDLVALYRKDGYHLEGADIEWPIRERAKVEKEYFEENPAYIDLADIMNRHENATAEIDRPRRWNENDKACYLEDGGIGYIMYENNQTKYGFAVYNLESQKKILSSMLEDREKHLVLVASLPEIFKWCKEYTDDNVITIFAYSEISVKAFEEIAKSDAAIRKLGSYEKEIMKYSEKIALFDHVTIYAEEKIKEKPDARVEELIDQIFRLFRYYNGR